MRRWLYAAFGVSAAVASAAVLVTGATEGQCTVVCTWEIPVVLIGMAAALACMGAGVWLALYELGQRGGRGSA